MNYKKGFVEIGTLSNFLQQTKVGGSHISEKQKFSNVRNSTKSAKNTFYTFCSHGFKLGGRCIIFWKNGHIIHRKKE